MPVHLAQLALGLGFQLLKFISSFVEILHDHLELLIQLLLYLLGLGHLLAGAQLLFGEIKFLKACLLLAERRLDFNVLFLILEHLDAHSWWSFWLGFLAILIKEEIFVDPIIQDVHEFLNLVEELLVFVVEINQLSILLLICWLKVDFELFLPFLFDILELA